MAGGMINVSEAKKIILENSNVLPPVKLGLTKAAGMVLAENIYAAISIPAYAQSSMDGYAFRYHDWKYKTSLNIKGEMAAGSSEMVSLATGDATRIFTGAPVPTGADTVVMQEKTDRKSTRLNSSHSQIS